MLQSFRDHLKGTVATILVVLIAIPFALFGVDSLFTGPSAASNEAATVNGEKISELELNRAVLLQKQRLEAQFGQNAPPDFLSEERLREPVLKGLIQRLLLSQEAGNQGMAVSERVLDDVIVGTVQFQQDGVFSAERYTQLLRNMGYTPAYYKRLLTQDLLLNQHSAGISDSSFVTQEELQRIVALSQQTRDFYYLTIPLKTAEESAQVSAEKIQAHYDENNSQYMTSEQVAINYLDISLGDLSSNIEIPEDTIRQQYEQEVAAFESQTQRHAAHILLERRDDSSEQVLLAELQKRLQAGEDFAELAGKYSDDLGSKNRGGDLGTSTGDTFPEEFESALAALEVGGVSTPVETDAGFHLIKLIALQGAEPPSFEQAKGRIASVLRQAEAEKVFTDILDKLDDLVYNADNLREAADELGVELKSSDLFGRVGGSGVAANSTVVNAAFSDEMLFERNTSDVLELNDNRVVVLRVTQHLPSRVKSLHEVKTDIIATLKTASAKAAVAEQATTLKQTVIDGKSIEDVAKEKGYQWQVSLDTRRTDVKVNRELLVHIFSLPKPTDKAVVTGLQLANGDYILASLTKHSEGVYSAMAPEQKRSLHTRMEGQFGSADFVGYEALLKERADIEISRLITASNDS